MYKNYITAINSIKNSNATDDLLGTFLVSFERLMVRLQGFKQRRRSLKVTTQPYLPVCITCTFLRRILFQDNEVTQYMISRRVQPFVC